jgi:MFS family permease
MFYLGHVLMALLGGYLSNKVPMWYLFMGTIVLHIMGYSLYALSVNGSVMMVSRILAGISMGAAISVSFAYLGFSTVQYAENLRTLGEYDSKKFARAKGFVYSLFNVGTGAGYIVGACRFLHSVFNH